MSEDEEDQAIERAFAALRGAARDWSQDLIDLELVSEWLHDTPAHDWMDARFQVASAALATAAALEKARG